MVDTLDFLVVDDDDGFRNSLCRALINRGYSTCGADSVRSAARCIAETYFKRAVVDLRMSNESGLDVVSLLKRQQADAAVLVLTGYGSIASAVEAMRRGAVNFITKPADTDQILAAFESVEQLEVPLEQRSLDDIERDHIQHILTAHDGNISRAARALGLHRRSLQRKLARWREDNENLEN